LFNEKDVYCRNKTFHQELDDVRNVYQNKANSISYGVRDEFRIGGQALEAMMECVDDMVSDARFDNPKF
jgi:hypothetical protein